MKQAKKKGLPTGPLLPGRGPSAAGLLLRGVRCLLITANEEFNCPSAHGWLFRLLCGVSVSPRWALAHTHGGKGQEAFPRPQHGGLCGEGLSQTHSPKNMHVPFWSARMHLEVSGCGNPSCWDLPPLLNLGTHEGFLARYILLEGVLGLCSGCCGLCGDGRKQDAGEPLLTGWVPLPYHALGLL